MCVLQCRKTYLLTCASNKDSNQPAHPCSVTRVFFFRMKTFLIFSYSTAHPVKHMVSLRKYQANMSLRLANMTEGTFFFFSTLRLICLLRKESLLLLISE